MGKIMNEMEQQTSTLVLQELRAQLQELHVLMEETKFSVAGICMSNANLSRLTIQFTALLTLVIRSAMPETT